MKYNVKDNDYLDIAYHDLISSIKTLDIKEYRVTAFYAQQCIEKSFKFLIENINIEQNLKTHNLRTLYRVVQDYLPKLSQYRLVIGDISDFYFNSRYPGDDFYVPNAKEAEEYYSTAKIVFLEVLNYVSNKEKFDLSIFNISGQTSFF